MTQDGKEDSMSHVDEGTLHAYLDGELPSAERAALEAHLAACATCRASLDEERALLERATTLLGSARPVERPAPPFDQLQRTPKPSPWRVRRAYAWAASIALALGLGYYLRNPRLAPGPAATPATVDQPVVVAADRAASERVSTREEKRAAPVRLRQRAADSLMPASADERARVALQRQTDSARQAPAIGVVASAPSAQADSVAPATTEALRARDSTAYAREPLRLEEVVVTGRAATNAAAAAPAPQNRLAATAWPIISRSAARSLLGTDPVGLPGLTTRRIRRSPGTDGTVVVEQAVDSSTVIQIIQRPAGTNALYDSAAKGYLNRSAERERADRLARFVGRLRVEITGPLSVDSLNRLLEQVAPLP